MKEWISVNDKLPEFGVPVLSTRRFKGIAKITVVCLFLKGKDFIVFDIPEADEDDVMESGWRNVTHWMPLPEPTGVWE